MLDPAPTDTGRAPADEPATRPAVRIAVAQRVPPRYGDPPALRRLATAATDAGGAELLVLPELYPAGFRLDTDELAELAESRESFAAHLGAVARTHRIAIVAGYPERGPDDTVYSSAIFVDADGTELAHYRKLHLFGDETAAFGRGHQVPPVCRWRGWGVGLALCYDIEFPELARLLADRGADLICVPAGNMVGYSEVPEVLVPARACENQVFVAYANYCNSDDEFDYDGHSVVASPYGSLLAEAGQDEPQVLMVDLDPGLQAAARAHNTHRNDRRHDVYRGPDPTIG